MLLVYGSVSHSVSGDPLESCEMNLVSLGQHLKKKEKEIELMELGKKISTGAHRTLQGKFYFCVCVYWVAMLKFIPEDYS